MLKGPNTFVLLLTALAAGACSSTSDTPPASSAAGTGGSAGATGLGGGAGNAPDAGSTVGPRRSLARSYARDDIPCTSDTDCCAVVDGCTSTVLVVSASDQQTVRQLLDEAKQTEPYCNACIPPPVHVACGPAGYCVAAEGCSPPGDHCGNRMGGLVFGLDAGVCTSGALSRPPRHAQAIFGCL